MTQVSVFHRLGAWCLRIARRAAWIGLWLATLVALFYAIENWRGRRAWSAIVREFAEAGDPITPEAVIPKPVPDEENFAATPALRRLSDQARKADPSRAEAGWQKSIFPPLPQPVTDWRKGERVDMEQQRRFYREYLPKGPTESGAGEKLGAPEDILALLARFDPERRELLRASVKPGSYYPPPSYSENGAVKMPHLMVLRGWSDILLSRCVAELSLGHADEACDDMLLTLRISESLEREPWLFSQLVHANIGDKALEMIWEGAVRHQWTESHLAAAEARLRRVNWVQSFALAMKGERNLSPAMISAYVRSQRQPKEWWHLLKPGRKGDARLALMPNGWVDQNCVRVVRWLQRQLDGVDVAGARMFPERVDAAQRELTEMLPHQALPYTCIARAATASFGQMAEPLARLQAENELARIVIALERHRLRHGVYPERLDQLDADIVPANGMPSDPTSGAPPHYTRNADDFTLYFDGWNRKDDGGVLPKDGDLTSGDYVWPKPKTADDSAADGGK